MIGRVGSEKRLCVVYSHADPIVDGSLEIRSAYEVYSYFCNLFWSPPNDFSQEATSTSPESEEEPDPLTTEELVEQSIALVAEIPVPCPPQETAAPRVPARKSSSVIPPIPVVPPSGKTVIDTAESSSDVKVFKTVLFETAETSFDVKAVKEKKPVVPPRKEEVKRAPAARPPPRGQKEKGGPSGKATTTQRPQGSREVNQSKVDSDAVRRQRSFVKRPNPSSKG